MCCGLEIAKAQTMNKKGWIREKQKAEMRGRWPGTAHAHTILFHTKRQGVIPYPRQPLDHKHYISFDSSRGRKYKSRCAIMKCITTFFEILTNVNQVSKNTINSSILLWLIGWLCASLLILACCNCTFD